MQKVTQVLVIVVALFLLTMGQVLAQTGTLVEPGVYVECALSPESSDTGTDTTVTRTITIWNYNLTREHKWQLGPTYHPKWGGITIISKEFTMRIPGARKNRRIDMPVPVDTEIVSGSLRINDVIQGDPIVQNNHYELVVDLSAATEVDETITPSQTTIVDQVLVHPPAL